MLCISYANFLETKTFLTIPLHDFTSLLGVTDDIQNIDSPKFIWGKHILESLLLGLLQFTVTISKDLRYRIIA